jgi:hypothetical protein
MRNLVYACVAGLVLVGCSQKWVLRREYTATLAVEAAAGAELQFAVLRSVGYADVLTCEGAPGALSTTRTSEPGILALRITNPTRGIVTLDWDHTAFVDGSGQSYRLLLLNAPVLPANVEAVKKPNAPVLAPGAHVDVLVYPDPPSDRLFFLPRGSGETTTFRIAFATAGSTTPHSEANLTATLVSAKERRSHGARWPRAGDGCLPLVGCDAGFQCNTKSGRCVDARQAGSAGPVDGARTPGREVEPFGGRCEVDSDCLPTLACVMGRCGAREQ